MRISDWSSDVCSSDLADSLILDLEDAVAPDAKPAAREAVAAFLGTPRAIPLFVRINPLDSDFIADDLAAMLPAVPDGIVLPKAEGASSLKALDSWLPVNMLILPIATETPAAIFSAGTYGGHNARLAGRTGRRGGSDERRDGKEW